LASVNVPLDFILAAGHQPPALHLFLAGGVLVAVALFWVVGRRRALGHPADDDAAGNAGARRSDESGDA
jgi:hypothetical protein